MTVAGPGVMGKTRLANALAQQIAGAFANGIIYTSDYTKLEPAVLTGSND